MNPAADRSTTPLWIGACRYYLGRRSYAVSLFTDLLIAQWSGLSVTAQELIQRDVEEAFLHYEEMQRHGATPLTLGDKCDRANWRAVRRLWKQETP